jgi:hypothetical protein
MKSGRWFRTIRNIDERADRRHERCIIMNEKQGMEKWLYVWMTAGFAAPIFSVMFLTDQWDRIVRLVQSQEFQYTGWMPVLFVFLLEGIGLLFTIYLGPIIDLHRAAPRIGRRIIGFLDLLLLIAVMSLPLVYVLYFLSSSGIDTSEIWIFILFSLILYFAIWVAGVVRRMGKGKG